MSEPNREKQSPFPKECRQYQMLIANMSSDLYDSGLSRTSRCNLWLEYTICLILLFLHKIFTFIPLIKYLILISFMISGCTSGLKQKKIENAFGKD